MPTAKRTLVKSGPELWAEVSDPGSLGALLEPFGAIRITRVADPSLVEWEGERAAGRLELEPSGFGTRVHLSALVAHDEPPRSFWSRWRRPTRVPVMPPEDAEAVLTATLDTLGTARHRPFTR